MNLKEFLIETYDARDLKAIARKMELSQQGRAEEIAERITKAFTEWLPDCMVGGALIRLYDQVRITRLKQVSAKLTSNIEGDEWELFTAVARKIPELAAKAEDWLFPPHLRFVLISCYSKRGLQRIAKEIELDSSGTTYALVERISRCLERNTRIDDPKGVLSRLRREADEDDMASVCEHIGLSTDGGKKLVFKRLSTRIPELDRLTKPEYFRRLEAKARGTDSTVESEETVLPEDQYSR